MIDGDDHPANLLILEKAKKKVASTDHNSMILDSSSEEIAAKKGLKRKRSLIDLTTNISEGSDSDMKLETAEGGQAPQATENNKKRCKVPVGVTLIGDNEDEVQLGVQKAMRLPRYFSSQSFGGSSKKCFNCGQRGHFNRDCPNARQERPCYLCAKFGHSDMRCPASKTRCYKCNRLGHVSRDCSYPQNSLAIPMVCIQCGNPDCPASGQPDWVRAEGGCKMRYNQGDLDVIRCYTCNQKGHLTCQKTTAKPAFPYCFNCGDAGHLGSECPISATYTAQMEKREIPNRRGLQDLKVNDSSQTNKRSQSDTSSYWQEAGASKRLAAVPAYAPGLNADASLYRYDPLPPVQHPRQHEPYSFQAQPLPTQQYSQVQYQYQPSSSTSSSFGQNLGQGGFTMGYAFPPQPGQHHSSRLQNGRR